MSKKFWLKMSKKAIKISGMSSTLTNLNISKYCISLTAFLPDIGLDVISTPTIVDKI